MRNLLIITALMCLSVNQVSAEGLELTDVIKQAREAQMKEQIKSDTQKTMQPVKNDNSRSINEQSAAEKINPKEILDSKGSPEVSNSDNG